jgi:glycosyltransferase involved in cell wall biosynthesis
MSIVEGSVFPSLGAARTQYRVLMIAACPFPVPRGTPIRILRMAEALGLRGNDVHVATYHLGGDTSGYPFTTHRIRNVKGYNKVEAGPSYRKLAVVDPLLAATVTRLTKELKPDIIHAHHYEGLLTALPTRMFEPTPIVYDAHVLLDGELAYYHLGLPGRIRRGIAQFLDRTLPRRADHVIAVSDEIRERLCSTYGCLETRVTVIANGVESQFLRAAAKRSRGGSGRRLIFTGNLSAYQGTENMLEAFRIVLDRRHDVRLLVVTSSDRTQFEQAARRLAVDRAIDYLPPVLEQLPGLIANADVALNPRTKCPGTPQKLLNYLACGVPIVSFAGSAKYLRHEENGLVVPDDDVSGFAVAIERLLDDEMLAERVGRAAKRLAEAEFSWRTNAASVERTYSKLLSRE